MDTVIPFSLVGNIFELRGAFDYGKYINLLDVIARV